ncbi:APH(3') family aminoglycoside O-phosphotransferase [Paenibacillus apiarius]|uniref:APH(3') family aminoglycoside O-phosphotransferase n=1 Tax=Paenibacillus apiarius TaxID=46240 RepID=UPI00197FEA98|nr:APH(3') family aminoglycoside O-phosphotransferase [Paenibacillus apiarius]MBN3522547.1 aminoglycoside 3'-phosphotransferase [Paenibacillus apiarius]
MMKKIAFPDALLEHIRENDWVQDTIGMSGAHVFQVQTTAGEAAYLKVSPSGWETTLAGEKRALEWLRGKLPVPDLLYYEETNGYDFLLMSAVEGDMCCSPALLSRPEKTARLLGAGLALFHQVDTRDCPIDNRLERKLVEAEKRLLAGLVDEADFNEDNLGKSAAQLYQQLVRERPQAEDIVFTHGDYCLPNILVRHGKIGGFIDLGRCGLADRYQDIGIGIRSMMHNFGTHKYRQPFLEGYGIGSVDEDKVNYYILLDEMF